MQSSLVRVPTKRATSVSRPADSGRRTSSWSPKARRWFQRMLSGVTHHEANRRRIRVITLTTSPRARALGADLNADFQVLRKRIMRRWPGAGFNYWKLRTSEGNGVLHVLYVGPWIPQSWLSQNWDEVHNSPVVWIQEFKRRRKRLVSYLLSHYLPAHGDRGLYTRMSWSWGWVFRGFASAWAYVWKHGDTMYDAIFEWNKLMRRKDPHYYYKMKRGLLYEQTVLKKRGIMGTVVFD
ncbi:hypothetical protein ES703_117441 [subsurface metagenome]